MDQVLTHEKAQCTLLLLLLIALITKIKSMWYRDTLCHLFILFCLQLI